jgi:hypothetical protein
MLHGTRVTIAFDTGAAAGDLVQTTNLDPLDLSRCKCIDMFISLTTADAAADDLFDIVLDETFDGVTWNERMHSAQFAGSLTATTTAPETYSMRCSAHVNLDTTEEAGEPSGSAGGTALAAGTVRNGPFAPKRHNDEAPWTLQPTHRLRYVTDDDDDDARFAGTVTLVFHSPV